LVLQTGQLQVLGGVRQRLVVLSVMFFTPLQPPVVDRAGSPGNALEACSCCGVGSSRKR
jgi:hypothetical protein